MPYVTAADGARIFFKDWGSGQPVIFSHGWPLASDAWDSQMLFLGRNGYRVIAHDRRGHGRSDQPWDGNDMNTYADDLATVIKTLDIKDAALVGHSTGGGEVVRYLGRHGTARAAKAVLVGAVPPIMLKSAANPEGTPLEAFDGLRHAVAENRAQLFQDLTLPFYGFNRPGATVSEGLRQSFWLQGMAAGVKAVYDCIREFSETDFSDDLKAIDIPLLAIHGDDDQIVPIAAASQKTVKLAPKAELKIYAGAPHGLAQTMPDKLNADLLAFIKG